MSPEDETAGSPQATGQEASIIPFPGLRKRPPRERLLRAMLEMCGELGYEQVAVRHVTQRAASSRATFYKNFEGKEDCFALAYDDACGWLGSHVLGAARREAGWREGLRAGTATLLEFCANQPAIAKSLFVEVHAAGERALERRAELMAEFAAAIDTAREERPDRSTPETTASFMVGAIETMITAKLLDGDAAGLPDLLPGILHFVVMQYYGEDEAWQEMVAAPIGTWRSRRETAAQLPPS